MKQYKDVLASILRENDIYILAYAMVLENDNIVLDYLLDMRIKHVHSTEWPRIIRNGSVSAH